jgi:glutamine amidotransferase
MNTSPPIQTSNLEPQTAIVIIDYGLGNLRSVVNAFAAIGYPATVSSDAAVIRAAERIVLPGVGAAGEAMRRLRDIGLDDTVREAVARGKPTLGLCLGMQLFFDHSEENDTSCLGILPGVVRRLQPTSANDASPLLKVPHIGWAQLTVCQPHPLLAAMSSEYIYFVHGYVCQPASAALTLAIADYGGPFVAIVGRGNVVAVQGHPERSDVVGLGFLRRFAAWQPLFVSRRQRSGKKSRW